MITKSAADLFDDVGSHSRFISLSHPASFFHMAAHAVDSDASPTVQSDTAESFDVWGFSSSQYEAALRKSVQRLSEMIDSHPSGAIHLTPTAISSTTFGNKGQYNSMITELNSSKGRPSLYLMISGPRYYMILAMNEYVVGYYDSELDEYVMMEDDRPAVSRFGDLVNVTETN
jgi:hypothetical protein